MSLSSRVLALSLPGMFFLLGACASVSTPLKTYEGPARPEAELAVLEVPEEVQVMAIDGREPPPGFLRSQVRLALLPGEHVLSLRYVKLFQLNADEHDVVRSRPAALRFEAVAGSSYRVEAPAQRNHEAAKQFAREPAFSLVDLAGARPAVQSTAVKSYAEASLIDTISKAFEASGEPARPVTNTDLLKDVWSRSSEAERDEFRAWINQQKN